MGVIPEEDKFSAGKVVRLEMKNFLRSASAGALEDTQEIRTILRLFLECFYVQQDMAPKEMDARSFRDAVLGILPRRFTSKDKNLKDVPRVVSAYMDYLKKETSLNDLPQIEKTVAELDKRFIKAVKSVKEADRIPDEPPTAQIKREDGKVGRNDPCICGSGKKYKKCCLGKDSS